MTGSFNPIDEGEWSEQAYIHPTALLFQAIAKHDRATVQRLLKDEDAGANLHRRDHVGRTALHVAILVKAVEIAEDLIDAGARITARLADGRAPLHLAAQYDLPRLINKLMERSQKNQFDLENPKKSDTDRAQVAPERPSSEDDWSSHDDEDVVQSLSEGDGDDEERKMKVIARMRVKKMKARHPKRSSR
jgi:ankyrin repeat protein